MNLKQLEYFVAIASLESVTKAAQRLCIAQPSLTRHIRNLETDLQVKLFEKDGRGIALTRAGTEFYAAISAIIGNLREADAILDKYRQGSSSQIRLGIPSSLSGILAERLLDAARDLKPAISLQLVDGWSRFILDWLLSEQLDVGIVYDHTLDSSLIETAYLASEQQFIIGLSGSFPKGASGLSLQQIAELPLILPSRQHGLRKTIDLEFEKIGHRVTPIMELDASPTIKALLERGGSFSILSQSDVSGPLSPKLAALPIASPPIIRDLFLAWRKDSKKLRHIQKMVALTQTQTEALVDSGIWGQVRNAYN